MCRSVLQSSSEATEQSHIFFDFASPPSGQNAEKHISVSKREKLMMLNTTKHFQGGNDIDIMPQKIQKQ